MNVKKVGVYIIIGLLISVLGITMVSALNTESGIWHDSTKISFSSWYSVTLGKSIDTLEDIINLKSSITDFSESDGLLIPGGHKASEIWVAVRNGEMNLLQAINSGTGGLCPLDDITHITYSGPTDKTKAYHYATEVEVTIDEVTTSLQDAINGGTFCWSYYWAIGAWSGCSVGCGTGTQTRIVYCSRNDGIEVADSLCATAGTKPAISQSCSHQCYWYFKSEQTGLAACKLFISPNYCFPDCSGGGCNTGVACNSYLGWYSDCWYNKYVVVGCTQRFYQCY